MLQELAIKNFAIIDDLHISFSSGLSVLSGETGAGKSIIINAVNLLLGSRASAKLIRTGEASAELEALFTISPESAVSKVLIDNGLENDRELVVRRIISRRDRHRIYINGRLSTIQMLTAVTENLASISGQHEHQRLLKETHQIQILDQYGGLTPLREKVFRCFHRMVPMIRQLEKLRLQMARQEEHKALLAFQQQEINQACIMPEEDTHLEQERMRLKNRESLLQNVHQGIDALYSAEDAATERLSVVKRHLEKAGRIDAVLSTPLESITDIVFRLEDISNELRDYLSTLQLDEGRLEAVEDRLDLLNRLKRKYGGSLAAVASHLQAIDDELNHHEHLEDSITETEDRLSKLHHRLAGLSVELSEKRKTAAKSLAAKVEQVLSTLKMQDTKFHISIQPVLAEKQTDPHLKIDDTAIQETGIDSAVFLISPNIGEELKPLAFIASGGELSRVILALKVILATTESTETLIFDEVDAGIGGGAAALVGKKLSSLAAYHQIICITHLPQIARYADHHFKISKHVLNGRTATRIRPLDHDARIEEIARMLGGEKMTNAMRDHARELLSSS